MARRPSKESLVDTVILLTITGLFLAYFRPEYLLSKTITTGGDTASHYYSAQFMKDFLLPHGRISGWTYGNYAGFPIFQFYFPLPFVVTAMLGMVIPLQIAFKLVTVLGIFMFPFCAYFSLRMFRYKFPVPIFGALFTLPFLFMEANSMWGGNILSTLAGEFTFSIGFALSVLYIGSLYQGITDGRHAVRNGLLLALVGFCHGYTLLFSVIVSLYFLVINKDLLKRSVYLLKVNTLAFMLMGLWILPLLYYMPYTTRYNFIWQIGSFAEVFPGILLPSLVIALLGRLVATGMIVRDFVRGRAGSGEKGPVAVLDYFGSPLSFLWFCVVVSGVFYWVAYDINVVDIRFLPFLQLFISIIAAVELGRIAMHLRLNMLTPVVLCIAMMLWINTHAKQLDGWIEWNYSGFEGRPLWPQFLEINNYLKGGVSDPRVVYEHSLLHNQLGTTRAFESLPLFAGRSTLEGVYMQSTLSSPFVFYIQSEISKEISCPLPDYGCSSLDLKSAVRHLTMYNVRDFIVRSDEVKTAMRKHPEFELKQSIASFDLYELTANKNRYVTPLKYEPVLYVTDKWKPLAYKWFKNNSINDVHIVYAGKIRDEDKKTFRTIKEGDALSPLPRIPVDDSCSVEEELMDGRIAIKTDCLHKPLLVKVSYHPRWKVEGAQKIYLASPAFMLVFPEKKDVTLTFSDTWVEYTGYAMSMTGLLIIMLGLLPLGDNRAVTSLTAITSGIEKSFRDTAFVKFMAAHKGRTIGVVVSMAVIFTAVFVVEKRRDHYDRLYAAGMSLYGQKRYAEARASFARLIEKLPVSTSARDASFLYAISFFLERDYQKSIEAFQRLTVDFPESPMVVEAYYHIGLSYLRLNDIGRAMETFTFLIDSYPGSRWAAFAKERLAETGRGGGS